MMLRYSPTSIEKDLEIQNIQISQLMTIQEDRSIRWKRMFKFLRGKPFILQWDFINWLGKFLLDDLLCHGTEDFTSVKNIMNTVGLGIVWSSISKSHRRMIFLRILSPFKGLPWLHKKCTFSGLELLDMAMECSDDKLTTALIRYGLYQIPLGESIIFHNISEAKLMLLQFCWNTRLLGLNLEVDMSMCSHMAKSIVSWLTLQPNFRRIQLILRILDSITNRKIGSGSTHGNVKCIQLFFETITDPFITKSEVNMFFRALFCFESTPTAANILSEDYAQLFPTEALGPLEPRSLLHLCRCSIRRTIYNNNEILPKQVKHLEIPFALKKYILAA